MPDRAVTTSGSPCSGGHGRQGLDGFAEAGVEEITLSLDTLPEGDTLRSLDTLAAVAAAHQ